ncbi:MAG: uncharacterized membrane protein YqaE (UPF0057 family) [Bacteroidia bacterium]
MNWAAQATVLESLFLKCEFSSVLYPKLCYFARLIVSPSMGFLMDLIRILFAVLLPPLGVFLQVGIGKHFWINIVLTLPGYLPGIIHAVYIIAKK